jgi:DNA-binding NarL/FixJ family response regulator
MGSTLRVLLATHRAGVDSYFRTLPTGGDTELIVQQLPLDARAVQRAAAPDHAAVAVVDVDGDHPAAVRVIAQLQERRPDLPIVALLCCAHGTTSVALHELSQVGVKGMLDLHATPHQTWETISAAARGNLVVQLRLANGSSNLTHLLGAAAEPLHGLRLSTAETTLLLLVSDGLSDQEMAARLFLSPHTIKHRVEALRQRVGARNRIALAAWAGRNGVARAETDEPPIRRRVAGAAR